jgi:hypothetical protein
VLVFRDASDRRKNIQQEAAYGQHSKVASKGVGVSSSSDRYLAGRLGFDVGPEDRGCCHIR